LRYQSSKGRACSSDRAVPMFKLYCHSKCLGFKPHYLIFGVSYQNHIGCWIRSCSYLEF